MHKAILSPSLLHLVSMLANSPEDVRPVVEAAPEACVTGMIQKKAAVEGLYHWQGADMLLWSPLALKA
ncbi:hypothetical protein Y1Q_0015554 [Alligator mississippiensis]|uniref:Uncharacterized protein n=1 Tax=Alligator mississippiensis TaxID=8496 RepID=A0A151NNC0_ALLMI|nr:hypothetical protein Y1Q_0015554 [Alligator mississippiensis]